MGFIQFPFHIWSIQTALIMPAVQCTSLQCREVASLKLTTLLKVVQKQEMTDLSPESFVHLTTTTTSSTKWHVVVFSIHCWHFILFYFFRLTSTTL